MLLPNRIAAISCGFIVLVIAAHAHAVTVSEQEIERAETTNRAWLGVIATRHAYENERLQRLHELKLRGHASWLEMSRQTTTVDALVEYGRAAIKFQEWLANLRQQLSLEVEVAAAEPSRDVNRTSIDKADDLRRLQEAKFAMDRAQREFDALQAQREKENESSSTSQQQSLAAQSPPTSASLEDRLRRTGVISLAVHPKLAIATLRTARVESGAKAHLKTEELLLRKSRLRLDAVTRLHEKGFAAKAEVEQAQEAVTDAEQRLANARRVAEGRQATWTTLSRKLALYDAGDSPEPSAPVGGVQLLLEDPAAMRYFIDLHRARFQTVARQREAEIEARHLSELVRRLEQLNLHHESSRREREMAGLNLELARSRGRSAAEQRDVWQHETHRFVAAVEAQRQRSMVVDSLAISVASLVGPRLAVSYLHWPRAGLFSHFGVLPHQALFPWRAPRCFYWRGVGYWHRSRLGIWPSTYVFGSAGRLSWWNRRDCGLGGYLDGLYYNRLVSRVGVRPWFRPWRLPQYYDFYTFNGPRHRALSTTWRSFCYPGHAWSRLSW